jgi:N-acyl-L-homoserine lactone synthetase
MVNALKRAKCPFEIIDETTAPAGGRVFLGLWDVSEEIAAALRLSTGLEAPGLPKQQLLAA